VHHLSLKLDETAKTLRLCRVQVFGFTPGHIEAVVPCAEQPIAASERRVRRFIGKLALVSPPALKVSPQRHHAPNIALGFSTNPGDREL
jgi:hypothetical protein